MEMLMIKLDLFVVVVDDDDELIEFVVNDIDETDDSLV
jgi:hypothetical protein